MKFSFDKQAAIEEIAVAMQTVEARATIANFGLFEVTVSATDSNVTVYSSNLDTGIKCKFGCQADEDVKFSISAERLYGWLRSAPGDTVDASLGKVLILKADGATARIPVSDAALPPWPHSSANYFRLDSELFKKALRRTVFVVPTKETHIASGVLVEGLGERRIAIVATDIGRMSVHYADIVDGDFPVNQKLLMDRKACQVVLSMLGNSTSEHTTVYYDNHYLNFGFGSRMIFSRGITGEYRKWQPALPNLPGNCVVSKEALQASANCVLSLSEDMGRPVVLTFEGTQLTLEAVGDCEAVDVIPVTANQEAKIKVQGGWLLEAVGRIETDMVCINYGGDRSPLEITESDNKEWRFVTAPMSMGRRL
jgi:DNA polymerase-3 subunit beta